LIIVCNAVLAKSPTRLHRGLVAGSDGAFLKFASDIEVKHNLRCGTAVHCRLYSTREE
jgi:hypothetical protein